MCVSQWRFAGVLADLAAQNLKVSLCWDDVLGSAAPRATKPKQEPIGQFECSLSLLSSNLAREPLLVARCLNNKLALLKLKLCWCPLPMPYDNDSSSSLSPIMDGSWS